jgi:hypothetical protein
MVIVGWFVGIGLLILVSNKRTGSGSPWRALQAGLSRMPSPTINIVAIAAALGTLIFGALNAAWENPGPLFAPLSAACAWLFIAICAEGLRRSNVATFGPEGFTGMIREKTEQMSQAHTVERIRAPRPQAADTEPLNPDGGPEELAAWAARVASQYSYRTANKGGDATPVVESAGLQPLDGTIEELVADALQAVQQDGHADEVTHSDYMAPPSGLSQGLAVVDDEDSSLPEEVAPLHSATEDSQEQPVAGSRGYGDHATVFVSSQHSRPWERSAAPPTGLSRPPGPLTLGGTPAQSAEHAVAAAPRPSSVSGAAPEQAAALFSYKPVMVVSRLGAAAEKPEADKQ